jgi:tripartite ATP-independent transporter DctP family solute receptor
MRAIGAFIRTATLIAAMSLASLAHADPVMLRIASPYGPEHSTSKAIEIFRTELVRRTHGALDVEFFHSLQLGGAKDQLDGIRTGAIFAIPQAVPFLARSIPETEALNLPFVFRNADHARRTVEGPVGKLLEARLVAKGFVPLGWMVLGARNVTNSRRPVKTLDDIKDLKIRVQPSETHMAVFRALGANPVAMDIKDVYTALKQGDVDAEENPYYPIYSNKFYEVQKYLSDTSHAFDLIVFLAGTKTFMALPPEQQKAVRDSAGIAIVEQWKLAPKVEADAFAALKAHGMQFDPIPDATRAALRKAAAGVFETAKVRIGAGLVDQVVAAGRR